MTPERILEHPARVLTEAQRAFYFREGYLLVEKAIPEDWIERLRAASMAFIAATSAPPKLAPEGRLSRVS